MKLTLFISIILLVTAKLANGQENYDIAKIPVALLKDATAVVRNEELSLIIKTSFNAKITYKTAVTILSKGGDSQASIGEYYDKFSVVSNLKATMYDAKGNKLRTYKSSDFKDKSLTADGTLFDDNRLKELDFLNATYPYTIEYSYDKDYNGYLTFPSWSPISTYNIAVEKSSFTIQLPEQLNFKFLKSKTISTDSTLVDHKKIYKWACDNLMAIEYEPMSTGLSDITPWVIASPNEFEFDNSRGNVNTWKNLGSWIYQLSGDEQLLPESIKNTVRTLVANAKNDKEKIAILYTYLQSNTRYVSVQLGIGGFKPIPSEKVAVVNYGDCKALSNYMKALLLAANIKSNLVMLGSGMPSLNPSYASFGQANHMILCVPALRDTTWLECTSQYMPAGFLGNSTSSKLVLLVTKSGGELVNTPTYKAEDNFQHRTTNVTLGPEGNADILVNTDYGACQYEDKLGMLLRDPTDRRKKLLNDLNLPNIELLTASYDQPDKNKPLLHEQLQLRSTELLSRGGDKLFLTLNLLNRRESVPAKVENRKTSFSLPYGFRDLDEIVYIIPAGYKADYLPKDVTIESEFGKYTTKTELKGNQIIYIRSQQVGSKKYPPEKYKELVEFYKKIYLSDRQKAVLAKIN
jgi:hypothetical protein